MPASRAFVPPPQPPSAQRRTTHAHAHTTLTDMAPRLKPKDGYAGRDTCQSKSEFWAKSWTVWRHNWHQLLRPHPRLIASRSHPSSKPTFLSGHKSARPSLQPPRNQLRLNAQTTAPCSGTSSADMAADAPLASASFDTSALQRLCVQTSNMANAGGARIAGICTR